MELINSKLYGVLSETERQSESSNDDNNNIPIPVDESLLIVFFIAFFAVVLCCLCVLCIALLMCGLYYGEKRKQDDTKQQLKDLMKLKQKMKDRARNLSFLSSDNSDCKVSDAISKMQSYEVTQSNIARILSEEEEKESETLMARFSDHYSHNNHKINRIDCLEEDKSNTIDIKIDMKRQESDGMGSQREGVHNERDSKHEKFHHLIH